MIKELHGELIHHDGSRQVVSLNVIRFEVDESKRGRFQRTQVTIEGLEIKPPLSTSELNKVLEEKTDD